MAAVAPLPLQLRWSPSSSSSHGTAAGRAGRAGRWHFGSAMCCSSLGVAVAALPRGKPRRCGAARRRAEPLKPLELQSEFDAEDPELRVEAAHSVGAFSLTSTLWPPKKLLCNTAELSPIKAETSVGRYTGSAPVFAQWPFYETSIGEVPLLEDDAEELKSYRLVDFEGGLLTRAFVLASRWQKANLGRSAGFERLGMGILSGFKATNPIMMRELQGLNVLEGYFAEKAKEEGTSPPATCFATDAELDAFLAHVEASPFIAAEFAAVAPLRRTTHVTGLVSSAGTALCVWQPPLEPSKAAEIHFCLGHDCLDEGPVVEERLLRLVAQRAQTRYDATTLRCRARFTEKGKLLVPCKSLGFKLAPGEAEYTEDMSDADALANLDFTKPKDYNLIPEAVPGLQTWLLLLCLEDRIAAVNDWCHEMGAATLEEVVESREELADFLEENSVLTPGEREALLERDRGSWMTT